MFVIEFYEPKDYVIHFYSCYTEDLYLTEYEIEEWLSEIRKVLDSNMTPQMKLQEIVTSICLD